MNASFSHLGLATQSPNDVCGRFLFAVFVSIRKACLEIMLAENFGKLLENGCPLPPQHSRGRRGCQKKAGVAKAAHRVEDVTPR
ncbi:hypothetical protein HPB50_015405 [Hyalomma asiaticum]|uniref:Uncharacterized protein n=1 Tax=Hyalomma asiaticum TaxID=266040 RepID=A0ACB7TIP1_HYAAI|nr:hypothetical protein HPB50_015405 [Hyalomma asiaticum]